MISFAKLQVILKDNGRNKTWLKTNAGLGGTTYNIIASAMKTPIKTGLTISAIDKICESLQCQPGDIMEYVRDDSDDDM